MTKYIVIAGSCPALHKKHGVTSPNQIITEDMLEDGEATDLMRNGFIEEYKPYKVTKDDLALTEDVKDVKTGQVQILLANRHHIEIFSLKLGSEIHENLKGFKKAPAKEVTAK